MEDRGPEQPGKRGGTQIRSASLRREKAADCRPGKGS